MGLIHTELELLNGDDLALGRRGLLKPEDVRGMKVAALVDCGAAMLAINENIRSQLGLMKVEERLAESADGSVPKFDMVGSVEVRSPSQIKDTSVFAMSRFAGIQPLIGDRNQSLRATLWVLLAVGLAGVGCSSDHSQTADKKLIQSLEALNEKVTLLSAEVQNLRKDLQSRESTDDLAELEKLESRLAQRNLWPKTPDEAGALQTDFQRLLDSMSPANQERHLSKLVRLRWAILALKLLASAESGTLEGWNQFKDSLAELNDSAPDGATDVIKTEIERRLDTASKRLAVLLFEEAVKSANAALQDNKPASQDGSPTAAEEALQKLDAVEDKDQQEDKQLEGLKQQLRAKNLLAEVEAQCWQWKRDLKRIKALQNNVWKQTGLSRIYDQAVALRLDLLLAEKELPTDVLKRIDDTLTEIESVVKGIARAEEQAEQERRKKYQRWALQQIAQYETHNFKHAEVTIAATFSSFKERKSSVEWSLLTEFDGVRELLNQKTGLKIALDGQKRVVLTPQEQQQIYDAVYALMGWKYLTDLAYATDKAGTTKYLLPIEPGLLDLPVQNLYSKAFQSAWATAQDGGYQLEIAQKTVEVTKKTLRDFTAPAANK